jgi:putative peptidoglycan lipid II flippase
LLGIDPKWGAAGLTASAGVAGWIEFLLLQRQLNTRIGKTGLPLPILARLWAAVLLGIVLGVSVEVLLPPVHPVLRAVLVLTPFCVGYVGLAHVFGLSEARTMVRRVTGRGA